MKKTLIWPLAILAMAQPVPAAAAPVSCTALVGGHISWMASSPHRRIGAKFARVKITSSALAPSTTKWGHISVSEGAFGWAGNSMSGRFLVAFNDRGFDPSRRDITDITLWADGRGEIILRSWGNARLPLSDFRCDSAGFLTAIEREGNGTSLVTLSFRRETI
jgi:hypothetical protein